MTISNALDNYYTPAPGQTFQVEAAASALAQLMRYAYSDISEVPTPTLDSIIRKYTTT